MKRLFSLLIPIIVVLLSTAQSVGQVNPAVTKKVLGGSSAITGLQVMEVKIDDINEWLCPTAVLRGDREFNGNGPEIKVEVKLRVDNDKVRIFADIYFWAKETQHDWSTTEGNWTRLVYQAPVGKEIAEIVSDNMSRGRYISTKATPEIGGLVSPNVVFGTRIGPDTYDQMYPRDGRLVSVINIKGDTPGDDISTDDNCDGDTKIVKIEFNPLKIRFTNKQ